MKTKKPKPELPDLVNPILSRQGNNKPRSFILSTWLNEEGVRENLNPNYQISSTQINRDKETIGRDPRPRQPDLIETRKREAEIPDLVNPI